MRELFRINSLFLTLGLLLAGCSKPDDKGNSSLLAPIASAPNSDLPSQEEPPVLIAQPIAIVPPTDSQEIPIVQSPSMPLDIINPTAPIPVVIPGPDQVVAVEVGITTPDANVIADSVILTVETPPPSQSSDGLSQGEDDIQEEMETEEIILSGNCVGKKKVGIAWAEDDDHKMKKTKLAKCSQDKFRIRLQSDKRKHEFKKIRTYFFE